jgi:CheY-like chemotaxis protein
MRISTALTRFASIETQLCMSTFKTPARFSDLPFAACTLCPLAPASVVSWRRETLLSDAITLLEDDPVRIAAMTAVLRELLPSARPIFFEDARQMLAWLGAHLGDVDLISLDHDLPVRRDAENRLIDCGTGREVADWLGGVPPTCPVIVHSSNEPCAAGMMAVLQEAGWPCRRVYPYGDLAWIHGAWAEAVRELLAG